MFIEDEEVNANLHPPSSSLSMDTYVHDFQWELFDQQGQRKYLIPVERQAFHHAAYAIAAIDIRLFNLTLFYTGARLSEVLELTPSRIDSQAGVIVVRCLKKRRKDVYRAVPVPDAFLFELTAFIQQQTEKDAQNFNARIWPWGRTHAWKQVKQVMDVAGIRGPQATPKGLRHAFAVWALEAGVTLPMVSKWMGHSSIETTRIYTTLVGDEERAMAEKMWNISALSHP